MNSNAGEKLPFWQAAIWAAALGAFFFLVYGYCNYMAAHRAHAGSFYWNWELRLPFVPQLILPYMSLDLFFAGSLFLVLRRDLPAHASRIVTAILVAGVCFLLFPLHIAFVRPATTGFNGMLFDWLKLDQPYNLVPSLHITLRSIVWVPYGLALRGYLRRAVFLWFAAIGFSTILTYQHQAIDVIGGEILTIVVFYLFPGGEREAAARASNRRLAMVYGSSGALVLIAGYLARPWGLAVLAWPACCFFLLAAAYAGIGSAIFRKANGRVPWAARILLGPYLLATQITARIHRPWSDPWNQVAPGIVLGRRLNTLEAAALIRDGVTAVLDLTSEHSENPKLRALVYKNIPLLDNTVPSSAQLAEAIEFIRRESRYGKVYVHCALGYSRSAGVVAAYLLDSGLANTAEAAVETVRRARPRIVISERWWSLLRALESREVASR